MALSFKLLCALLILVAGLVGALLPIMDGKVKQRERWLYYGEYFARGIFLSAGLIHLLPDAANSFHSIAPSVHYPVIFAIAVFTLLVIQVIEQVTNQFAAKTAFAQHWMPYLLMILLSIHSIVSGAALGIDNNLSHVIVIFIAIMSHKTAEGFALGLSMRTHRIAKQVCLGLIIVFSLMTPLGIVASTIVSAFLNTAQAAYAQAIFGGIAAGTFLYMASFKSADLEDCIKERADLIATLFFGLGITLMATVALVV